MAFSPLILNPPPVPQNGTMVCASCGHGKTHLVGVQSSTEGRDPRLEAQLTFTCERGCRWSLTFMQSRGETVLDVERLQA